MPRDAVTAFVLAALTATGCAADGDELTDATPTAIETVTVTETVTEATTPTEPETDGLALTQQCTNPDVGYEVSFPEGWHTNAGDVITECRLFDPQPIQIEEGTEIPPEIAVRMDRANVPLTAATEFGRGYEVVERRTTTVAGRDAVVALLRATEEAPLLEPGTMVYSYYVALDGQTLIADTTSLGQLDLEQKRQVLDQMMDTLVLSG